MVTLDNRRKILAVQKKCFCVLLSVFSQPERTMGIDLKLKIVLWHQIVFSCLHDFTALYHSISKHAAYNLLCCFHLSPVMLLDKVTFLEDRTCIQSKVPSCCSVWQPQPTVTEVSSKQHFPHCIIINVQAISVHFDTLGPILTI